MAEAAGAAAVTVVGAAVMVAGAAAGIMGAAGVAAEAGAAAGAVVDGAVMAVTAAAVGVGGMVSGCGAVENLGKVARPSPQRTKAEVFFWSAPKQSA